MFHISPGFSRLHAVSRHTRPYVCILYTVLWVDIRNNIGLNLPLLSPVLQDVSQISDCCITLILCSMTEHSTELIICSDCFRKQLFSSHTYQKPFFPTQISETIYLFQISSRPPPMVSNGSSLTEVGVLRPPCSPRDQTTSLMIIVLSWGESSLKFLLAIAILVALRVTAIGGTIRATCMLKWVKMDTSDFDNDWFRIGNQILFNSR